MEKSAEGGVQEISSLATLNLYRNNLFRTLGLPVYASASDVSRHQKRLAMKQKLGISDDGGQSRAFALSPPPDAAAIRNAHDRLSEPQTRLLDEIFWFWPLSEIGKVDSALQALEKGDLKTALAQWNEHCDNGSTKRDIAVHNLAVCHHLQVLDIEMKDSGSQSLDKAWEQALSYWKQVLDGNEFWSRVKGRVRQLDDVRMTTGFVRRIREKLPETLLRINADIAVKAAEDGQTDRARRAVATLRKSPFDEALVDRVLREALSPIRQRIRLMCRAVGEEGDQNPKNADQTTQNFIKEGTAILGIVDIMLPERDPVRVGLHDDIASAALACAITFCNETEAYKKSLALFDQCRPIASGEATIGRIDQNYATVKSNLELGQCFFCEDESHDESVSIKSHMYGDVQDLYTKITWKHRPILVPRCRACRKRHNMANLIGFGALLVAAAVCAKIGLMFGAGLTPKVVLNVFRLSIGEGLLFFLEQLLRMTFYFNNNGGLYLGAFIGGLVIGPFLFHWFRSLSCQKRFNIKPYGMWNQHSTIKQLQSQGWKFGERPPSN